MEYGYWDKWRTYIANYKLVMFIIGILFILSWKALWINGDAAKILSGYLEQSNSTYATAVRNDEMHSQIGNNVLFNIPEIASKMDSKDYNLFFKNYATSSMANFISLHESAEVSLIDLIYHKIGITKINLKSGDKDLDKIKIKKGDTIDIIATIKNIDSKDFLLFVSSDNADIFKSYKDDMHSQKISCKGYTTGETKLSIMIMTSEGILYKDINVTVE